ncbi:hypothetical protein [Geminisphaera colitermitum]|uniref:hypothetical protein n=1 Tax=Geminisphaera colitermitum TaxID=1148786 RepID=UPI000196556C|nr:hypothetical protein [Geminisphaera colitermitum]
MSAKTISKIASGKRTPNEVLDAFAPEPLTVANLTLRPLSISDFLLLERLDSPFADQQITPDTDISVSEIMEVAYILATPPQTSRAAFAKGRAAFDDAVAEMFDSIPPSTLGDLGKRIATIINAAFATLITPAKKKEAKVLSSETSATASAGF